MHQVSINGIRLYAYHGCLDEEGRIGQEYEVNVLFEVDFTEAAMNDDLTKTVDYVVVYDLVKEEMTIRSKLIEHVAYRIHSRLVARFPQTSLIKVSVVKFGPPVNGIMHNAAVHYQG